MWLGNIERFILMIGCGLNGFWRIIEFIFKEMVLLLSVFVVFVVNLIYIFLV